MTRARRALAALVGAMTILLSGTMGTSVAHANPGSTAAPGGSVEISFDPAFVTSMFKAGVFCYGASEVTVYFSDSGSLAGVFPLSGQSRAKATTRITVDPEVGGMSFFNGPAQATAGLLSIAVRRTGATGTLTGRIIGPFSKESGQFSKTVTLFTISQAVAKGSGGRWTMDGTLTLTADGASTLNSLLQTTVFVPSAPVGTLSATVGAPATPARG